MDWTGCVMLAGALTGAVVLSAASAAGAADTAYWVGPERTPGPFLCKSPAATGVTVVCDRWPDGS
ncbi:MAG: hypothetical protein R6V58_05430, partial [Planctomycetota bacterium]